jgi:site-specific DNA-methyltransferase (adenine-specific)
MKREVPAYEGESVTGFLRGQSGPSNQHGDSGGASRFFPQFEGQTPPEAPFFYTGKATKREATIDGQVPNRHPTKKPLALMQWLVRLVTPKKGICLDPFAGSGTTCVAAIEEGVCFIGIEKDPDFYADTVKRVAFVLQKEQGEQDQRDMFDELMNG